MDESITARDQLNQLIGKLIITREWCTAFLYANTFLGSIFLGLGLARLLSPETSGHGTVFFALLALLSILYKHNIQERITSKKAELVALSMEGSLKRYSPPSKGMVIGSKVVAIQTKQLPDTTRGGKEIGKSSGQMLRK